MKNIPLLCLLFCLTILGCDKEKSGTPKSGNGYYMYSITIDGVTHKIEGNLNQESALGGNTCIASEAIPGTFVINVKLRNENIYSYVSGSYFEHNLIITNIAIGTNYVVLEDYSINNNNSIWPPSYFGFVENLGTPHSTSGVSIGNFNINSLGSPAFLDLTQVPQVLTYGDPVIGSFSGTVFGHSSSTFNNSYDVPVQLEIEFVAPRTDY